AFADAFRTLLADVELAEALRAVEGAWEALGREPWPPGSPRDLAEAGASLRERMGAFEARAAALGVAFFGLRVRAGEGGSASGAEGGAATDNGVRGASARAVVDGSVPRERGGVEGTRRGRGAAAPVVIDAAVRAKLQASLDDRDLDEGSAVARSTPTEVV